VTLLHGSSVTHRGRAVDPASGLWDRHFSS
jgi:hypothetical protein